MPEHTGLALQRGLFLIVLRDEGKRGKQEKIASKAGEKKWILHFAWLNFLWIHI